MSPVQAGSKKSRVPHAMRGTFSRHISAMPISLMRAMRLMIQRRRRMVKGGDFLSWTYYRKSKPSKPSQLVITGDLFSMDHPKDYSLFGFNDHNTCDGSFELSFRQCQQLRQLMVDFKLPGKRPGPLHGTFFLNVELHEGLILCGKPWKSNHHFYRLVSEPPLF